MEEETPRLPGRDELKALLARLKDQEKLVKGLLEATDPPDLGRLARLTAALSLQEPLAFVELACAMDAWLVQEKATRSRRLGTELRAACEAAGVSLEVLGRAPLELRLPPVSVVVDLEADRAEVQFGRTTVTRCRAQAEAILAAREKAVRSLEGRKWDPGEHHARLREAWQRAGGGGWVELETVLPELVMLVQSKRFRQDPSAENFRPYGRAQFAYDLWRLRRDRCLAHQGWRLSLGPATGGSTADKRRVFWLESDDGRGQYHLTLRFLREDAAHG